MTFVQECLRELSLLELACPTFSWFCRVPSSSNPADLPSRGQGKDTERIFGSMRVPSRIAEDKLWKLVLEPKSSVAGVVLEGGLRSNLCDIDPRKRGEQQE